jgi:hypothetical protein
MNTESVIAISRIIGSLTLKSRCMIVGRKHKNIETEIPIVQTNSPLINEIKAKIANIVLNINAKYFSHDISKRSFDEFIIHKRFYEFELIM